MNLAFYIHASSGSGHVFPRKHSRPPGHPGKALTRRLQARGAGQGPWLQALLGLQGFLCRPDTLESTWSALPSLRPSWWRPSPGREIDASQRPYSHQTGWSKATLFSSLTASQNLACVPQRTTRTWRCPHPWPVP